MLQYETHFWLISSCSKTDQPCGRFCTRLSFRPTTLLYALVSHLWTPKYRLLILHGETLQIDYADFSVEQ